MDASTSNSIAIIGMAGRFPGASSVAEFWRNQLDGVDSISHFTVDELEISHAREVAAQPEYVRARGVLADADLFDAGFFSMLPREAERTDPQQRLFLECCWQTLESAGYDPAAYPGSIGVYAGTSYSSYFLSRFLHAEDFRERYASEFQTGNYAEMLGNHPDFLATRVAYKLNLRGPSFTLAAGCSTSLIAVCQAAQSLLAGQCDMALAGAASITLPQKRGYLYQAGGMGSADGVCRTFDADAQGTVFGSGVAAVLLKRLHDAVRDGDTVHAVLRGFALNNDGSAKIGYTAPSVEGQAAVIAAAHRHAGVTADSIGYVEAHGTATPLGDPIELAALARAFRASDAVPREARGERVAEQRPALPVTSTCVLGTAKTNIGHLDVVAGIAGLIHAVHIVREATLPPTLHFKRPTDRFDWDRNPFRVNASLAAWEDDGRVRRAGVSAFGVGGTNAHLVIEQAPRIEPELSPRPAQLLLLSARSGAALAQARTNLASHIGQLSRGAEGTLADVAYTLQVGRRAFAYRSAIVAESLPEAVGLLEASTAANASSRYQEVATPPDPPELCFLFPGQGAQQPEMCRALYETEAVFRETVDRCAALLSADPDFNAGYAFSLGEGLDLRQVLYPDAASPEARQAAAERLMQTSLAQPAIFVTEYALSRLWASWGIVPATMVGHSVGEYVAACLAGVFSLEDALHLISVRGRLMQGLAPGVMLSVRLPEGALRRLLARLDGRVSIAAINAPLLCVAAGPEEQVARLEALLLAEEIPHRRLHTSHAFHSSMMDPILEPFTEQVRRITLHAPRVPYVSTLSGDWITAEEATDPAYWARHFREPVRFAAALGRLSGKRRLLLEAGPGSTLATLARQQGVAEWTIYASLGADSAASAGAPDRMQEARALQKTLGQLWVEGCAPDWKAYHAGARRQRVPLPTYPFERKRFWIDLPAVAVPSVEELVSTGLPAASVAAPLHAAPSVTLPAGSLATPASLTADLRAELPVPPSPAPPSQENISMASNPAGAQAGRASRLRAELADTFHELSGLLIDDADAGATFLELGLDSLFLTQITQAVQKQYGVKVTFRQLMNGIGSLEALAAHVDATLPAEAAAVPTTPASAAAVPASVPAMASQTQVQAPPPGAEAAAMPAAPNLPVAAPRPGPSASFIAPQYTPLAGGGAAQQIFQQQIGAMQQLFSQQIAALQGGLGAFVPSAGSDGAASLIEANLPQPTSPTVPTAETVTLGAPVAPPEAIEEAGPGPAAKPTTLAAASQPDREMKVSARFKAGAKNADAPLTPVQAECVRGFIERYCARTAGSKRVTQQQRAVLADPRVVAGFRKQWKELIYPVVAVRSKGAHLWDVDGNQYVDILNGFGPIMLGHRPAFVQRAVEEQLRLGFETGPQTLLAGEVAQMICAMTGNERATFCNTGSEAVTAALRIARTVTGRDKVVFFAGDYHGMFDEVLVKGLWKGGEPYAVPAAPGIPRAKSENVIVLEYGAEESLAWIRAHAGELAAVMVEPVQSRNPDLQPVEFLRAIRQITEQSETCFIFDEVVTGFRTHPGGCQALFGIRADLVTYGKVLAGGMPIGVLCGKRQYMDALDGGQWEYGDESTPEVGVTFFAGTFVRHPLAMAACRAVLKHFEASGPQLQQALTAKTAGLVRTLNELFARNGVPAHVETFSSIFYVSFASETRFASLFYYFLRDKGIHLLEGFPCFLTTEHSPADLDWIVRAFTEAIAEMQAGELLPAPPAPGPGELALPSTGSELVPAGGSTSPGTAVSAGAQAAKSFPLTEAQREIWLAAQLSDEASCAFNESFTLRLTGALDEARLRASLQQLVDRHESLRGTVSASGEQMVCAERLTLQVPLVDLAGVALHGSSGDGTVDGVASLTSNDALQPFDLQAGPLIRMYLVRLATEEHALVVTAHHIVCDGWSVNVLLDELSRLYQGESLPAPVLFSSFAVAERVAAARPGSEHRAAEAYWLAQFGQPAARLDLPVDRTRPAIKSYPGATYRTRWTGETARLLRGAGAAQGCTLFVTLLSGFSALLSRLCNQRDIVVGIPTAGQSLLDESALVGHAVNFLPIRTLLKEGMSFAELLKQTQRTLLDAYDHQSYTYGTLVGALKLAKDVSRLPLIEVQFNLEKIGGSLGFGDLQAQVDPNPKAAVNFDLFLNIVDTGKGLLLDCDYNTDLFDRETIARWLGHYETLLRGAAAASAQPVEALPLLSAAEREQLVGGSDKAVAWRASQDGTLAGVQTGVRTGVQVGGQVEAAQAPHLLAVHRLFETQCARTPQAVAVQAGRSGEGTARRASYAELLAGAKRVAAHLARLGVRPGDLVGIAVERGIPMLEALLGVWMAGAAYVPLDPGYPQARLDLILADTRVPVLLTDTRSAPKFQHAATQLVMLDALDQAGIPAGAGSLDAEPVAGSGQQQTDSAATTAGEAVETERLAYIIFTSGSTGRPKGVEVTHGNLSNFLQAMQQEPGMADSDRLLAVTTLSFDIAALELFLPLVSGATVVLASREEAGDGRQLRRMLEEEAVTVMQATPATWRMLFDAGWTGTPQLKMLCGGEALSRELATTLLATGGPLWNMYGPTETTVWSAVGQVRVGEGTVPIGPAIANTRLYVLDALQQPQPPGVPGELYIGGAGVARGYYNRPDLSAERFVADPFAAGAFVSDSLTPAPANPARMYRTGDLVRRRVDGQLEFLGRLDHQVKVNGFRIELGEIESALARYPGVREVVVLAREDQPGEKRLVAYLVVAGAEPSVGDLRPALGRVVPDFMVPSLYLFLPELPKTPNGKIDRQQLPAPEARHLQRSQPQAPRTATETTLARIFAEVLRLEQVDTAESLFHLGADSIHLFQIVSRARAASLDLSPQQVLRLQSVQAIAAALDEAGAARGQAVAAVDGQTIKPVARDRSRAVASREVPHGVGQS